MECIRIGKLAHARCFQVELDSAFDDKAPAKRIIWEERMPRLQREADMGGEGATTPARGRCGLGRGCYCSDDRQIWEERML